MSIYARPAVQIRSVALPEERIAARREKGEGSVLQVRLLAEAVRAAGQFQRSALGHMDHENWLDRVKSDGQRLADLLKQMGFTPNTDRSSPGTRNPA